MYTYIHKLIMRGPLTGGGAAPRGRPARGARPPSGRRLQAARERAPYRNGASTRPVSLCAEVTDSTQVGQDVCDMSPA